MKDFNQALLTAKGEFSEIKTDKKQERGGKEIPYASLYAVVNSIQTHLLKEKFLTDTHLKEKPMKDGKSKLKVITKIIHVPSNQSKKYTYSTILNNPAINQERGSAMTYGRRYNLLGAFDLKIKNDSDDNDGTIEVEEVSADKILEGIQAEEVQILAELTAELNSAATKDELSAIWSKKNKQVQKLGNFMQNVLGIAKDKLKEDLKDAA